MRRRYILKIISLAIIQRFSLLYTIQRCKSCVRRPEYINENNVILASCVLCVCWGLMLGNKSHGFQACDDIVIDSELLLPLIWHADLFVMLPAAGRDPSPYLGCSWQRRMSWRRTGIGVAYDVGRPNADPTN